jgi:hypothetical protein
LVEIACFSDKGIFVPAGIVTIFGSEAVVGAGLGATAAGAAAAGSARAVVDCGAASCPSDIPEISNRANTNRITTSEGESSPAPHQPENTMQPRPFSASF